MTVLFVWLVIGTFLVLILTNDVDFVRLGLLDSTTERLVAIWAWPAVLFMLMLFPFCRDDNEKVVPKL